MKIMKWKDATATNKKFLYMVVDKDEGYLEDNRAFVYVNYPTLEGGVIYEAFPITVVEDFCSLGVEYEHYKGMVDLFEGGLGRMPVASLDTCRDVVSDEDKERLVVVFDDVDISIWINKLESLKSSK